ncbi:MAG: hypothetical protein ACI9KE_004786, partial [Polyangiales bacterium]
LLFRFVVSSLDSVPSSSSIVARHAPANARVQR